MGTKTKKSAAERKRLRIRSTLAALGGCCYGQPPEKGDRPARESSSYRFRNAREATMHLENFAVDLNQFLTYATIVGLPGEEPKRAYREMLKISQAYPQEPAMRTVIRSLERRHAYLTKLGGRP